MGDLIAIAAIAAVIILTGLAVITRLERRAHDRRARAALAAAVRINQRRGELERRARAAQAAADRVAREHRRNLWHPDEVRDLHTADEDDRGRR